jgi:hypothetical protein
MKRREEKRDLGISNGYEKNAMISVYQLSPNVDELHLQLEKRRGQWIDLNRIPSTPKEHFQRNETPFRSSEEERSIEYQLWGDRLIEGTDRTLDEVSSRSFHSSEETGMSSGNLLGWGFRLSADLPEDQSPDDGRSLTFQSSPLKQSLRMSSHPFSLLCRRMTDLCVK